jgi:hypothetical protein
MPKMLGEGTQTSARDEMRQSIERVTPRTWKRDKVRLLELVDRV